MAQCKVCARNGVRREGTLGGVCPVHARRKCAICSAQSYGEEFCPSCAGEVQQSRRKGRVFNPQVIDEERARELSRLDRGNLQQGKLYMFEAVECFFIAIQNVQDALRAPEIPGGAPRPLDDQNDTPKAA